MSGLAVVTRHRRCAGIAFLLGLFWLWAVVALAVQSEMSLLQAIVWIAWAVVIMTAAVRARA